MLTVTVTKTAYTNGVKDFSVTPGLAAITVGGWGTYGSATVGGGDVTAPALDKCGSFIGSNEGI